MLTSHPSLQGSPGPAEAAGRCAAGLPSAMAAKLVRPDKAVMAVVGDGGFLMNSQVQQGPASPESVLWCLG